MTDTDVSPNYVPSYLRGRVSDITARPDGSFALQDPLNAKGRYGSAESVLDAETFRRTFDPDHRLYDLSGSVKGQYDPPSSTNFIQQLKGKATGALRNAWSYGTSSQGKSLATVGLLSALLGGGYGAYRGLRDPEGSGVGRGLLYALLAGSAGLGATALMQARHNQAMAKSSSSTGEVAAALVADASMKAEDRKAALKALLDLTPVEVEQLKQLLRTSFGAAAGVIVMRFLGAKGLLPGVAAGILGGIIGRATATKPIYNAFGQLSTANFR